jgi:hypothetical protein
VPGLKVHGYVARQIIGKAFWKVDRQIDRPVVWMGRGHRKFNHDFATAVWIARQCYPNDATRATDAAILHLLLDFFCSQHPEWKKLLEELAAADAKRRKQARKVNKKRHSRQQPSILREIYYINELRSLIGFQCSSSYPEVRPY